MEQFTNHYESRESLNKVPRNSKKQREARKDVLKMRDKVLFVETSDGVWRPVGNQAELYTGARSRQGMMPWPVTNSSMLH